MTFMGMSLFDKNKEKAGKSFIVTFLRDMYDRYHLKADMCTFWRCVFTLQRRFKDKLVIERARF